MFLKKRFISPSEAEKQLKEANEEIQLFKGVYTSFNDIQRIILGYDLRLFTVKFGCCTTMRRD